MTTIISLGHLKIYHSYGGDIDGLLRIGTREELATFGGDLDNVWTEISSIIQDIELIEKGLVSKEFAGKSIEKIKSLCDQQTFDELTKAIS